jgi:CheY-like chemotaxis protein
MTRILIVEDSSDILFILQWELKWMGYEVHGAADARTGLEVAKLRRPDVIVSDLRMPGMDGCEFIKRIRQIRELSAVPAIALTGSSMHREVQQALAAGFSRHLVKPVDTTQLATLIEQITARRLGRKAG